MWSASAAEGVSAEVWRPRAWWCCIESMGERLSGLSLAVIGFDTAYNLESALPELMLVIVACNSVNVFGAAKMSEIVIFLVLFVESCRRL